jgi:hypothetical protein
MVMTFYVKQPQHKTHFVLFVVYSHPSNFSGIQRYVTITGDRAAN